MVNINIIKFENIVELEITKRPSKIIKSPYVADAIDKNNIPYLVYAPGLGLADQCLPGSTVYATPSNNKDSKTDFIIQSVSIHDEGYNHVIVGANPHTAETIGKEIIKRGIWNPYPDFEVCNKKPSHIDYIGDIYLKKNHQYIVIEMKNVICATFNPELNKIDRRYIYFDHNIPFKRSGIYPNGEKRQRYKGESVVSKRSLRQIDEMIENKENYHFVIIFLVNRSDCLAFKPNWQRDPAYSKKLATAVKNGIDVHALSIDWSSSSCSFVKELEIDLKTW